MKKTFYYIYALLPAQVYQINQRRERVEQYEGLD